VLLGQGVSDVGAERQRGSLRPGHPCDTEVGGIHHRSPPTPNSAIVMGFSFCPVLIPTGEGLVPVPVGLRILTTVHS